MTRPRKVEAYRLPCCWHICMSIVYRWRNRHQNLWWICFLLMMPGLIQRFTRNMWLYMICPRMSHWDGLWWPALRTQVVLMSEMIDTLQIYHTNLSTITRPQRYFCPRTFFGHTGMNPLLWNSLIQCLHPNQNILQGWFQALLLVVRAVFKTVDCHLPPLLLYIFGKFILNKLVCKFDRMENSFSSLYVKYIYW